MLVDKTVKVEKELDTAVEEIKTVATKVVNGEAALQVLVEEVGKLPSLVAAAVAVPGDFVESLNGALRALALGAVDVACIALKKALA